MLMFVLVIAGAMISSAPLVSQSVVQETTVYRNLEAGLSIPYPSDWIVESGKGKLKVMIRIRSLLPPIQDNHLLRLKYFLHWLM